MKKFYIVLLSFVCLCSMSAYAWHDNCNKCNKNQNIFSRLCNKPCETPCQKPCEKKYESPCKKSCELENFNCFLCTKANQDNLFKQMNLSETQICAATKIQDKYEQEVLSLNERIQCDKEKLAKLENNCGKKSDIRREKRSIKKLERKRKDICKCYEKQFQAMISNDQNKIYKKYR